MKKIFPILFMFLMSSLIVKAQSFMIIKGSESTVSTVKIKDSTHLQIKGNLKIDAASNSQISNDAYLQNNGRIKIMSGAQNAQSGIENNVDGLRTYTEGLTTGEILFQSGSAIQFISGSGSVDFMNLRINNTANPYLELNQDVSIANQLILDGLVDIDDYDMNLLNTATLVDVEFSESKMIQADANGKFIRAINTGAGDYLFPIGDGNATYSPVLINMFSNSNSGTLGFNVTAQAHPEINNPLNVFDYLNRFWSAEENALTSYTYNLTMGYSNQDVTGDEQNIKISRWDNQWFEIEESVATANSIVSVDPLNEMNAHLNGDFTGRNASPTSINEVIHQNELIVYPNPASNQLYVQTTSLLSSELDVSLYNSIGQCVYKEYISQNNGSLIQLNIENLSNGVYLVKITNSHNQQSKSKRIVISK